MLIDTLLFIIQAFEENEGMASDYDSDDEGDVQDDTAETHEYRVGRFCFARAQVYHELQHIRFHL